MEIWTIRKLLKWTTQLFESRYIQSARLDAEVLLAYTLGVDRIYLYLHSDQPLTESERDRFRKLIKRRTQREPIAYLVKNKEFWSITVEVDNNVLIPRPMTETMVKSVVERLIPDNELRVGDLGVGSGCITMALASELKNCNFWCVDISKKALKVARKNFERLGISSVVQLFEGSWFTPFENLGLYNKFDVIVSNPPYIKRSAFRESLQPEIRKYEPRIALDGGVSGLDSFRILADGARKYLKSGGFIAVEFGNDQSESVYQIFSDTGLQNLELIKDEMDVDRVLIGYEP